MIVPLTPKELAARERSELAKRVLMTLIEKHDDGQYDKSLAFRAVTYADDLIKVLNERKPQP